MKIKSLLRFVLLLACLTIGVETYAEAEGTIEIQLISKKGLVFPFDPNYDTTNTYILSSGTTALDSLRILATAGGHPLELIPNSDKGGITVNFANTLLSLTERQSDGSYYIVTAAAADFNDTNYKNTITFEYSNYAPRTIKFEVDNTTIIDFSNMYIGGEYDEDRIGVIGSASIGVSILNPRDGGFVNLEEGKDKDYTVGYSSSNSLVAEISGNMVTFKKESTSVTLTATLTLNNHNYACPRGTYNDVFKVVAPVTLKNTEKGYLATFSSIHNRDFSGTGIEVYIVEAIDDKKAKLTRVADNIVNAGEGVLLYSTSEKTDVVAPIAANELSTSYTGNLLKATGADDQTVDGANDYILQNEGGKLAFYKATGLKMKANRAYLQATAAQARSLELNFDDETTGISEISTDTDSQAVYYNLGGQRISQPRKGSIFVKNGKKIVR